MATEAEATTEPDTQRLDPTKSDLVVDIVDAVAAAKDVDPMAEELQLGDQVDLDAIATLCASHHSGPALTVEFTVDNHTVTVQGDGQVTVT